jgi:hypothetical protein
MFAALLFTSITSFANDPLLQQELLAKWIGRYIHTFLFQPFVQAQNIPFFRLKGSPFK